MEIIMANKQRDEMQDLRIEQKFVLNEKQAALFAAVVRGHLGLDRHSKERPDYSYDVHSVYLDSDTLESYWSTLKRKNHRFKLRVRFYDDDSSKPAYVEIKGKAGKQTVKQRCPVPREHLEEWFSDAAPRGELFASAGDLDALEQFLGKARRLRAQPKLHVAYRREAYVSREDNAIRITFDRDVRSEPVSGLRLATRMRNPQLLCGGAVIMELKCAGEMPAWLSGLIDKMNPDDRGFTKYVSGIEQHGLNASVSGPGYQPRRETSAGRSRNQIVVVAN
jgi:hypothetical protein